MLARDSDRGNHHKARRSTHSHLDCRSSHPDCRAILPPCAPSQPERPDALAAILPAGARASPALPAADAETLRHLAAKGMGANAFRALTSDRAYLEAWSQAVTGGPLPWPASADLVLRFIAHHLYDPAQKAGDAAHGMPEEAAQALLQAGSLRSRGPHAPATVQRRLATWTKLHHLQGLDSPVKRPEVGAALKLALRACNREQPRKSAKPITLDVLERILATCWLSGLIDVRDRVMLLTAFCSGGRRRSEVVSLTVAQIHEEPDLPSDIEGEAPTPCLSLFLGHTKTENAQDGARVVLTGYAAEELKNWLALARIKQGPVFRSIGRWGELGDHAMTPEAFNRMIKRRCERAGLPPHEFSAHGLRSGYLTQACRQGVPLIEAMRMTRHKSYQQAARYYDEAQVASSKAARLVPKRPTGAGMPRPAK